MEDSRRYETAKYIVSGIGFILDLALLTYLLSSGWTSRIRDFAASHASLPSLIVLLYFAVVGGAFGILQLPLDFISGYYIEHHFGLSRQKASGWLIDEFKGLLLGSLMGLAAVEMIYYLLRAHPDKWWVLSAVLFIAFFVILTNLAPVLLLPLFFKFTPVNDDALRGRVDRLAQRAGTQVRGVFEWSLGDKTRKANAAVVGWGNTRRIIVSDTLLKNFSSEEMEVILAHELCHHVKGHIWLGTVFQGVLTFISFYTIDYTLRTFAANFHGLSDVASFPLIALTAAGLSVLVLPAVNYFSRRLETAADLYALEMTRDSLAFVSSMDKLAELNLANKSPNKIIEFIFYSHPSIDERIKLAADYVGQVLAR